MQLMSSMQRLSLFWPRAAITTISGFSKIFNGASRVLSV